jgi:predicted nucleotidyltransferase component of viral defense system
MLARYKCKTPTDFENALKEIIQEIALLGLWRQKFFEHALFYGGTSLRILYKLQRFSEDLDFSLLKPNPNFNLNLYHNAIKDELEAFGFKVTLAAKDKKKDTQIESAFIKAGTKINFLNLKIPDDVIKITQSNSNLKIKFELDTNPPGDFKTDVKTLLQPTTFQVKTMTLPCLFASKLHAVIARQWKPRVKGRDYYDLIWFISQNTKVDLKHLRARLAQSGHLETGESLNHNALMSLLKKKIATIDFAQAKKDVSPFIKQNEQASLTLWDKKFFLDLIETIESE